MIACADDGYTFGIWSLGFDSNFWFRISSFPLALVAATGPGSVNGIGP